MFRINPPGNYRQYKQQPSASARTEREAFVSEDNIISVNDLLPPHAGAISTPLLQQEIQPPTYASSSRLCVCVRIYDCLSFSHTQAHTVYNGVHVPFLFQVWLWIARCRAGGAAGRTFRHCSAEEVHKRSRTASYQVKELFFQLCRPSIFIAFTDFFAYILKNCLKLPLCIQLCYPLQKIKNCFPTGINNLSSSSILSQLCFSVYL